MRCFGWLAGIAESSDSAMLLVGVADVPPWILSAAPLASAFGATVAPLELLPAVDAELRRCVALVPIRRSTSRTRVGRLGTIRIS